jgi:hypothetical protein
MKAPERFVERLEKEFRGRLRIRWSTQFNEWVIEQRVARGLFPGTKPTKKGWDESNDNYIRHRDGYIHVMSVRTGDRMPCPKCGHQLKVPYMQTQVIRCDYCRLKGFEPSIAAVFIPLNDDLIHYLKKIDPENPLSERLAEDLENSNQSLAAEMERKVMRDTEAGLLERFNRIAGIPQTGYTKNAGKMWIK